jgi:dihydropyrimidinase
MLDIIIKNGKVVSPETTQKMDVGIKDGKVVMMGFAEDMPEAVRVIDAKDKYVVPGGIDPHAHFESVFMGTVSKSDHFTGMRAAAVGGTTMCIDFANQAKGRLPMEIIEERLNQAKKAPIDYAFHAVITDAFPEALAQMKDIIEFGIPTFKCFMIYRKEGIMADDGVVLAALEQCKKYNGLFGAHTENAAIAEYNIERALHEGHGKPIWHALTKPSIVEAECINRALFLAKAVGVGFYDFHMSCKEGVEMIRAGRAVGYPFYAETITHYLCKTKKALEGPDGINYICSPPLREEEDIESLWKGLADGTIQTVGSDEAAYDTHQKNMFGDSFESVPNGLPGVEFRIPVVFSEGVNKGRISVNRFVEVTSTNAAKIMGMYPQKGIIAVGSDADIVIINPELEKTISVNDVQVDVDWTPYDGIKVKGWPIMTISRGHVIVENGKFLGQPGKGKFVKRKLNPDINYKCIV